jgi:hypothetical protein
MQVSVCLIRSRDSYVGCFGNLSVLSPTTEWFMQVTNLTVALPGKLPVDGATYGDATSSPSASSSSSAPAIAVVSINAADLEVVTAAPQADTPPAVDLAALVDTTPPVITLLDSPYMSVIQFDPFTDPGATVYDNIDGNSVPLVRQVQLCARPSGIQTALANDSRQLACGSKLAVVDTMKPSEKNEVFVITYSAQDQARNSAKPLRRYVEVQERWVRCVQVNLSTAIAHGCRWLMVMGSCVLTLGSVCLLILMFMCCLWQVSSA